MRKEEQPGELRRKEGGATLGPTGIFVFLEARKGR